MANKSNFNLMNVNRIVNETSEGMAIDSFNKTLREKTCVRLFLEIITAIYSPEYVRINGYSFGK